MQSYQRFQCIGHMGFKGLSNAVTNTHPLLPSMGTTRQKSSCRNGLQNGPRLLSRVKAGTHSAFGEKSHTRAHTAKQGYFGWGWYHYSRRALRASETLDVRLSKRLICRFLRSGGRSSPHDSYFLANIQVSLSVISVANVFALWYDKSHKSELSEMWVSQNDRKGKNAEQMLHDANDAKELSDDWDRAKDLCYDYSQLRPSKELFAL